MMATLLLVLLKQWRRSELVTPTRGCCSSLSSVPNERLRLCTASVVATAPDILSPLSLILESVLQADQHMMERTKAKIFSALISVLHIQGETTGSAVSQSVGSTNHFFPAAISVTTGQNEAIRIHKGATVSVSVL